MENCEADTTSCEGEEKRAKFGTRFLTDPQNVFQHNAWDNVVWDEEQEAAAQKIAMQHASSAVSSDKKDELERDAVKHWDGFYGIHQNHFFKDRHWLFTEFPELYGEETAAEYKTSDSDSPKEQCLVENDSVSCSTIGQTEDDRLNAADGDNRPLTDGHPKSSSTDLATTESQSCGLIQSNVACPADRYSPLHMLEVGCGVGNTVFPVLKTNKNPHLMVYCCDFSPVAIDIVKANPDYDSKRCHAFVHDITDENAEVPFPSGSLDIIIMIFVLSAVSPEKMQAAVNRLASYLKPGGTLLFRDYGRYDMAQLRFKEGRCLSQNFYVRGDGTRVYFFTQDELKRMFEQAGLTEKENLIDRRLQVNRGRQLKMYRVWIQCKYTKPLAS